MTNVAICVPTFKRPGYLSDLLQSINRAEMSGCSPRLIVADNDPEHTAQSTVEALATTSQIEIAYVTEPRRGLASIRNRLLSEAIAGGADYIAFVDDDQIVESDWLRELLDVAYQTCAAVVVGRWEPHFEPGVPKWVRDSGFWDRTRGATGASAVNFGTGNVLIRAATIAREAAQFDERYNVVGGEDTEFFQRLRRNGHVAVWAPRSLVYERIPASRATASWMIRRGFRVGLGHGRTLRWSRQGWRGAAHRTLKSGGLVVMNSILIIPAATRGKAGVIPRLAEIARGVGGLAGLAGFGAGLEEYRKIHGR